MANHENAQLRKGLILSYKTLYGVETYLWLFSALLTASLFLFPANFAYRLTPIQSLSVFGKLFPLFSVLYYFWLFLLFILAAIAQEKKSTVKGAVLVIFFIVIQIGFWIIPTNFPIPKSDGTLALAYISELVSKGHLLGTASQGLSYFYTWPAIDLFVAVLVHVTILNTAESMVLTIFVMVLTTGVFVYFLFRELLQSVLFAFVACVLYFYASVYAQNSVFTTLIFGWALYAATLWLLIRALRRKAVTGTVLGILLLFVIGTSLGEFITSLIIASTLLALLLFRVEIRRLGRLATASVLFTVLVPMFSAGGLGFLSLAEGFLHGALGISAFRAAYDSKIVYNIPVWVGYLALFWQLVLIAPVPFIILMFVTKRFHNQYAHFISASTVGMLMFSLAMATGGPSYLSFVLLVFPIFTVPFIFIAAVEMSKRRIFVFFVLIVMVFSLSLPTFVAYNRNQAIYGYNSSDVAGYSYLQTSFPWGSGNSILGSQETLPPPFLEPNTNIVALTITSYYNQTQFWGNWQSLMSSIHIQAPENLAVFSPHSVFPVATLLGVPPNDAHWKSVEEQLQAHDVIYNNNELSMYV